MIFTAVILLILLEAFLMGGIGSFLGDLFFYPAPMYVSLAVHGLQALIGVIFGYLLCWNVRQKKLSDHNIA